MDFQLSVRDQDPWPPLLSLWLNGWVLRGPGGWNVCSYPSPQYFHWLPGPGVWGFGSFIIVPYCLFFLKPKHISLA